MTYDRAAIMRDAHKRFRDGKRASGSAGRSGNAWPRGGRRRRIGASPLPEDLRRKLDGLSFLHVAGFDLLFAGAETPRPWM